MSTLHSTVLHGGEGGQQNPAAKPRVSVWIHSLMTSSKFLAPLAQKWVDAAAAATGEPWTAVLLDSRLHGESAALPGFEAPHTVDSMADDVVRTLAAGLRDGRWGRPEVLVGHSIGGLIVLELAQRLGRAAEEGLPGELADLGVPRQVWVLDSRTQAIRGDNPFHAEVQGVLAALTSLPYPVSSVDDVTAAAWGFLQAAGVPAMPPWLPAFCTHTVKRNPSGPGFVRHWNVEACQEMLASYCAKDYRALLDAPPRGCTLHLVQGEACSQWANEGQGELAYIREQQAVGKPVRLWPIPGCTHWIPVSHEAQLLGFMESELPSLKARQ